MNKEECEAMGGIWVPSHYSRTGKHVHDYKSGNYVNAYCREKSKREREKHVNEHAMLFVRSQKSKGASFGDGHFGGPDRYVAVVTAPKNVEIPSDMVLREDSLEKRGMKIKYFGEGYSKNHGPRSSLGRAKKEAEEYVERINRRNRRR